MPKKSNVRFCPATDLSVVHAAFVVATGGVSNDAKTEQSLAGPTSEINTRLLSSTIDVGGFWSSLFAAVAAGQTARHACEPALLSAGCSELQVEQTAAAVASRLDECRIAFHGRFPKLHDQLMLRSGPLKDRWDTYGPGLLIETAEKIWQSSPPSQWWPETVDCLLVQPIRGGDGGFDSGQCRVWMEAMLTDADAAVGEIFRLAFLVTQVAVGRHLDAALGRTASPQPSQPEGFGSGTHRRTSLPWRLGCVPVVLAAGADLEILRPGPLPIRSAIHLWRLGDEAIARVVEQWWGQWGGGEAAMPVALKALHRMLEQTQLRADDPSGNDADEFADSELDR